MTIRKIHTLTEKQKDKKGLHFIASDWVACIVFVFIAAFLIYNAPYGITEIDDAVYQTISQRLNKGDKLIADEWLMVLLNSYFWYLPYKIFYAILGGTQGILLCLRYLHCAVKMVFYWAVYAGFRKYRHWAVLAASIYVGFDPFGIKSQNYYSFCSNALLLMGLLLFVKEEVRPVHYFFAGFLLSCAVVAEPGTAILWFLYTALVFVQQYRKKRTKPLPDFFDIIPNFRAWRIMLLGLSIAFILFVFLGIIFFFGTDYKLLLSGIKQMIFDSEYTPDGNLLNTLRLTKVWGFIHLYHPVAFFMFFFVLLLAMILHRFSDKYDFLFFQILCILYVVLSVKLLFQPIRNNQFAFGQCVSHPLFLAIMGVPAYVFSKKKNKKLFLFLCVSFLTSFCVDVISDCAFGSTLLPGNVCSVMLLKEYLSEQPTERGKKAHHSDAMQKRITRKSVRRQHTITSAYRRASIILVLAAVISVEAANYGYSAWLHETEYLYCKSNEPLEQTISIGCYKGIKTIQSVCSDYESCAADMQRVHEVCKRGLFIPAIAPGLYLDADVNISTYSAFPYGTNRWEQTKIWWDLHPNKKPDVIYIPNKDLSYFDRTAASAEDKLEYIRTLADITVEKGVGGIIVLIKQWY